jgi:hypothetical protein
MATRITTSNPLSRPEVELSHILFQDKKEGSERRTVKYAMYSVYQCGRILIFFFCRRVYCERKPFEFRERVSRILSKRVEPNAERKSYDKIVVHDGELKPASALLTEKLIVDD